VITIEGLGAGAAPEADAEQVPQQVTASRQIMAAAALLRANPRPTDADIDAGMPNICRCATYVRIKRAIHRAAEGK
jgi:aerobic-type carbon monoxide dehydrogenase small subunit (CoxS/CutS family)